MIERAEAEEHLRVIRSLMERATIYRAISAPTALVGGVLSIAASALLLHDNGRSSDGPLHLTYPDAPRQFILVWFAVLAATLLANTFFVWRKARREGGAFFTPGLNLAIASTSPVLIVATVLTSLFWRSEETTEALPMLVIVWIICYGLALLATANFSPVSLRFLGWLFLLTGTTCLVLTGPLFTVDPARRSTLAMAISFGVFHLLYGVATWPRRRNAA